MDLKKAYEIMGLEEDSTMEELTERYYALTEERLARNQIEDVQNAYNMIRDHIEATAPTPEVPLRKKISDFFYVYKLHVFGGTIAAVIIGLFAYTLIGSQIEKYKESKLPPPAIEVLFFGEYMEGTDLSPIEENIYDMFPDWERIKLDLVYSPVEMSSELDFAAKQKSTVILATERPDIYIFDKHHLEGFLEDAPLITLDPFENEPDTEDKWVLFQTDEDEEEHIYGIDLTDSDLFAGSDIADEEKIAVIREESENKENSIAFLLKAVK